MQFKIKLNNNKILPSILLALMFDIQALSSGFMVLTHQSILTIGYILLVISTIIYVLINRTIKLDKSTLFVGLILVLYYIASSDKTAVEPIYFGIWVLFPILLSCLEYRTEYVLRFTAIFVMPMLFISGQEFSTISTLSMGTTYNFFPAILASLVHFMFYRNDVSKWMRFVYIGNFYLFFKVLLLGSRGPVLAIIIYFIFVYFCRYVDSKKEMKIDFPKFVVSIITVILIMYNYLNIFSWLSVKLESRNLNFNFIDKVLRLAADGDVTNGRNGIIGLALKLWGDRPIFGHGISTFNYYTSIDYPHNFIFQLLFDGGVFLTIIIIGLMIRKIYLSIHCMEKQDYVFFTFMFIVAVPTALLSQDLFENFRFWIFEFLLLNGVFMSKNSHKNKIK